MSVVEMGEEKPLYDLTVYKTEALERICKMMKDRIDTGSSTEREKEVYRLIQLEFSRRNIQNWVGTPETKKENKVVFIKK